MATVRGLFFGSKLRGLLTVFVLLAAVVGGAFTAGILGTPEVDGVENRFAGVNETDTTIRTDLTIDNPNPFGVSLGGATVNYTVDMNDVTMATGFKKGIAIESGTTTLEFTTRMKNERIPGWWASHIKNGERTQLKLDANVHSSLIGQSVSVPYEKSISTDVIGQFNSDETRPVNAGLPVVSDPVLYVNETSAAWGSVTESETPIDMDFAVYNPKTTPYTITEIGYEITMNDIGVGNGSTDDPYTIPGKTRKTIEAETVIQNGKLDEWWVSHLERNQVTDLRIDFTATIELPTGNTIEVPLEELAYEKRIETDFFGNKDASGNSSDAEPTPTSDDSPETTSSESDPTGTPTGTPTPTDEGLLDRD